jgi:hypothetical protein
VCVYVLGVIILFRALPLTSAAAAAVGNDYISGELCMCVRGSAMGELQTLLAEKLINPPRDFSSVFEN